MKSYLEFEKDIKTLEEELEKLKDPFNKEGLSEVNTQKISQLQSEIDLKLKTSYANLNEWQKTQVARHEERPKAKFFIENLFTNFVNNELLPGTGISKKKFWHGLDKCVHELAAKNKNLLEFREILQKKIDIWHRDKKGEIITSKKYLSFLRDIGYWSRKRRGS